MELEQEVVEQYISLSVSDPFRENRSIQIQVRTTDEESGYHSKVARYLAVQKTLLGHFYQHIDQMTKAGLQNVLLRAKQTLADSEREVLKGYMCKSMTAILVSMHMRRLVVNGTHVQAYFHLDGIASHMDTDELMVPFTNLRIAQDIESIDIEDPAPIEQAA